MFSNYSMPGPSRQSFASNESQNFYDYPPRVTAAERLRSSNRGARQNFMTYPSTSATYQMNYTQNQNQNQNQRKYQNYKDKKKDNRGNRPNSYNKKNKNNGQQQQANKKTSKGPNEMTDQYKCPNCTLPFNVISRYNSYAGKVPLILDCKHTVCQECIYKLGKDGSIICPVCETSLELPSKYSLDSLQDIFSPNFYIVGFLLWFKSQNINSNPNHMSLVPTENSKKIITPTLPTQVPSAEICCFLNCNKAATLHCKDCSDIYCSYCCTAVHKSAKSMWSHKQTPLSSSTKGTLDLNICPEHNMIMEFFCITCDIMACCYCCCDKHESHNRENLSKLTDNEMQELQHNIELAKKLFKQLLISQKRLNDLYAGSTDIIEKKIVNYFTNFHAKLQCIEKKLKKDITKFDNVNLAAGDFEDINSKLITSIDNLKNIIHYCGNLDLTKSKINLKELFSRLKSATDIPSYLISKSGQLNLLDFEVDLDLDEDLEDCFKIKKTTDLSIRLVKEEDLPSDYEMDNDLHYESDVESTISTISKTISEEEKKINRATKQQNKQVPLKNELVEVSHIESLDCFYVRLKKSESQLSQMNREISDYIKMGAPMVENPQLNELYLALYKVNDEKIWCRGRLVEIKHNDKEVLYEVFFIDYGSTQTVDISKLRQITSNLTHRKYFAIRCELYNPSMAIWNKNAHRYMAKVINKKQVTMLVKRVHNGIHEVDLMIVSSDRGQTSITDILIHASNALCNSDNESISSTIKHTYNTGYKIYGNSTVFQKLQEEKVILVNIIDPHNIFVHLMIHSENLRKMNNLLKLKYKNSSESGMQCLPVEGTYVVIEYRDPIRGNWHRGLVKKVDFNSETCHALLVDWGLNVIVPISSIHPISEEFTKLESQVILVKLAQIEPLEEGVWTHDATTFLQKYFRSQEVMRIIVYNTDPLEVALFEIVGDVDICINALLVEENYANSTGKISQTVEVHRNDAEVKLVNENGFETNIFKQIESLEDDSEDEDYQDLLKKKIEIVKFVSPDLFYIKFTDYEKQEMSLYKELNVHYNNDKKTKESWNVDEFCVVLHNSNYTRGRILEKLSENKYKVNLYDLAFETIHSIDNIFEYTSYFKRYQNITYKAFLANVKPAGGSTWSMSAVETLEKMLKKHKFLYGTKIYGDFTNKSMAMQIWYSVVKVGGALEASKSKYVSINNLLVKLGFAYKTPGGKAESTSSRSTSPYSKSESTSPFISVIEKLAGNSSETLDFSTDQESIPEVKKKNYDSKSWNELFEEEKNSIKKKSSKNLSNKIEEAVITDWEPLPIKETEFEAWLTCAEIGGIIFVREAKYQKVYEEMEKSMKDYFDKQKFTFDPNHTWEPGQLCTISSNGYFYRGKICEVDGDLINVVMVDFGSDHNVTKEELSRAILHPEVPVFTSKVKLDRVYAKSGSWMVSDYETLLQILTEYGKVVIKGPLSVDIPSAEIYTDRGVLVNEKIVELCPNLTRYLPEDDSSLDEAVVVIEEDPDDYENKVESPVDTKNFEYNFLKLTDDNIDVVVMFVLDYNKIAIKEVNTIKNDLFELNDKIQEEVANLPDIDNVQVGMPCVCQFSEDGKWYRAQIFNIDDLIECGFVYVSFVDFGNIESVSVNEIKMMRPEWFKCPVSCHVANLNIELISKKHQQHVTQFIRKLSGKTKKAKVVAREPLSIHLYEQDGKLSYESLLKKKLIKKIQNSIV